MGISMPQFPPRLLSSERQVQRSQRSNLGGTNHAALVSSAKWSWGSSKGSPRKVEDWTMKCDEMMKRNPAKTEKRM